MKSSSDETALEREIKREFPPDFAEPQYELADIFRKYGGFYRANHILPPRIHKAMRAIENCRTSVLGAHKDQCDHCNHIEISYNSCRNRHCPKCQASQRFEWVSKRELELLPIQYFHIVFTLPEQLNQLLPLNNHKVYDILCKAAADTLQRFAEKRWQGKLGIIMALHTWGQTLSTHPHVHCIVTGGVLKNDHSEFVKAPKNYLFPVQALSPVFRGKYLEGLSKAYQKGDLKLGPAPKETWQKLTKSLYQHDWVVYAKQPFDKPQHIIRYVGRYINRVAISNHRIRSIEDGNVIFDYHDYRDSQDKILTLCADEFIRRFLNHILPERFRGIRYYGILSNSHRKSKLVLSRELLGVTDPERPFIPDMDDYLSKQAFDPGLCQVCGDGHMLTIEVYPGLLHDPPKLHALAA